MERAKEFGMKYGFSSISHFRWLFAVLRTKFIDDDKRGLASLDMKSWGILQHFPTKYEVLQGFKKLLVTMSFYSLVPFKNWDCMLKHFCHLLTEYLKFSLNLLMWLDQLVGMEFPGQWVTNKNLWVGSPRSGMLGQCIRSLAHRRDRWRVYITNLTWKSPYLNRSTSHTELQFTCSRLCVSPSEGSSLWPGGWVIMFPHHAVYFVCTLATS